MSIKPRLQTKRHGNKSIHWTHQFAVEDRVKTPYTLEESTSTVQPERPAIISALAKQGHPGVIQARMFSIDWPCTCEVVLCIIYHIQRCYYQPSASSLLKFCLYLFPLDLVGITYNWLRMWNNFLLTNQSILQNPM